ncbi:MAG TPA: VOC family protein [Acidimicrobiia bacterium]|jgi:predicted 3-demethylubiquinone-9 3-methyltransferase (glyoxalase superfamily)|nr:VOC family protein [Acidimicrobiia bacterium]
MPKTTTCLWFDNQGEDAAKYYTSIFPNSKITDTAYYLDNVPERAGQVLTVEFELDGRPYTALNGGPLFTFSEAISIQIYCEDQKEVDYYWDKLAAGGEEGPCGWLKDKFGLSWQVVPTKMMALLSDPDKTKAQRAMECMMGQKKLDLDAIEAAFHGTS